MAIGRVTRAQSRRAARHWREAEALLLRATAALDFAGDALDAGELATSQTRIVRDLADAVRNAKSDVGYAAGEQERASARGAA